MTNKFDEKEVSAQIIKIIEAHLGEAPTGNITTETSLESIEIESIDMVEIVFNIEDEYDINVPLDEVSGAVTVGDLSDRLIELLKSSQQA